MTCTKSICRIKKRQASIVEVTRVAGTLHVMCAKKQRRSSESRQVIKFGTSSPTASWKCTRSCAFGRHKKNLDRSMTLDVDDQAEPQSGLLKF